MNWTTRVLCTGQRAAPGCRRSVKASITSFYKATICGPHGGTQMGILHRCPECGVDTLVQPALFPRELRDRILSRAAYDARQINQRRQAIERTFNPQMIGRALPQPIEQARNALDDALRQALNGTAPMAAFTRQADKAVPVDWFRLSDLLRSATPGLSGLLASLDSGPAEILVAANGRDLWIFDAQSGSYVLPKGLAA